MEVTKSCYSHSQPCPGGCYGSKRAKSWLFLVPVKLSEMLCLQISRKKIKCLERNKFSIGEKEVIFLWQIEEENFSNSSSLAICLSRDSFFFFLNVFRYFFFFVFNLINVVKIAQNKTEKIKSEEKVWGLNIKKNKLNWKKKSLKKGKICVGEKEKEIKRVIKNGGRVERERERKKGGERKG